jgi:hypothetical protein
MRHILLYNNFTVLLHLPNTQQQIYKIHRWVLQPQRALVSNTPTKIKYELNVFGNDNDQMLYTAIAFEMVGVITTCVFVENRYIFMGDDADVVA